MLDFFKKEVDIAANMLYNIIVVRHQQQKQHKELNTMSKKYYAGYIGNPETTLPRVTDKAYCFTYAGGFTAANDEYIYVPKSQCIESEPNEYGNRKLLIPLWIMMTKSLDINRLREFSLCCNGEADIVTV